MKADGGIRLQLGNPSLQLVLILACTVIRAIVSPLALKR
jgi:hypothetical protein